MFQLSFQEFTDLKRQIGTSRSWGGRRKTPLAFTEQGVAMLSSVLRSRKASLVNVQIMRTFVKMRAAIYANQELAQKMEQLEYRLDKHDHEIVSLFEAINQLMVISKKKRRPIGFRPKER
jgi:chromosomal replication initiation ATPase DnaA